MALETSAHSVTGYFAKRSHAEDAVEALQDAGFGISQISLSVRPEYNEASETHNPENNASEKTDGVWNKVVGFFEGKSRNDADNNEQDSSESSHVVGEPVHGGYAYNSDELEGSIKGLNVSEEHAKYFNHHFGQGEEGALVTVSAAGREDEAEAILERHSGDVGRRAEEFEYPNRDTGETDLRHEEQRVQLFGEVLKVHKERVERGEVTIRKNIVTVNKTFEVPVTREELVITRHAVSGDASAPTGSIGESHEIRIPLSEEQVHLDKTNVILEEVSVGKRTVTDSKSMSGDVKHEELEIDDSAIANGDVKSRF